MHTGMTTRGLARWLTVGSAALSLLLTLSGCGSGSASAAVTPRILFVGDSLTKGYFASTAQDGYAALVTAHLHGVAIDTHAAYGVSAAVTLARLRQEPQTPITADLVVLELGTNDVVQTDETPAHFAATYAALVAALQARVPASARWVCLGVWRAPTAIAGSSTPAGTPYDAAIHAACPGMFVPLSALYMTKANHGPAGRATWAGKADWFHPNDTGHAAIARAVLRAIHPAKSK